MDKELTSILRYRLAPSRTRPQEFPPSPLSSKPRLLRQFQIDLDRAVAPLPSAVQATALALFWYSTVEAAEALGCSRQMIQPPEAAGSAKRFSPLASGRTTSSREAPDERQSPDLHLQHVVALSELPEGLRIPLRGRPDAARQRSESELRIAHSRMPADVARESRSRPPFSTASTGPAPTGSPTKACGRIGISRGP